MPFQSALSSGQLDKLRGTTSVAPIYGAEIYISFNANTVVYSARINQVDFFFPTVDLTYDGGSGTLADVMVGMTVLISTTNDPAAYYFRGRIRKDPTATIFYINETGKRFADNDYIFVIEDFDAHIKLARWGGEILLDWENSYAGLPPLIYDVRPAYADLVDSVSGVYEIDLAPTVVAGESGETISAYLWTVPTGVTITAGSTTTKDITIECDPGEYWIHFKATDSAGNNLTRHIKIWAHDDNNPPTLLNYEDISISCELPVDANEGASQGYSADLTAFAGVDAILERSLACVWVNEEYNGAAGSLFNNILAVGRLRSEVDTTTYTDEGQRDASLAWTLEGPLAILSSIDTPSIEMLSGTAPSTYVLTIPDLTIWRSIWALMTLFSTFAEVYPVSFSSLDDLYELANPVTQGSDLLSSLADLQQSISSVIQQAPDGRCEIVRRGVMLLPDDRENLDIIVNLDSRDYLEITFERDYRPSTARVLADGGGYDSGTGTTSAYLAVAPPGAPDDAPNESTLPRQVLAVGQTLVQEQTEIATRAGDALAAAQPPNVLRAKMVDGYRWLTPAVDQWYNWTLTAEETVRGHEFDNATRWWLQAVEVSPDPQQGTMDVTAVFVQETRGNPGQIIPFPVVDTGDYGLSLGDFDDIEELPPVSSFGTEYDFSGSGQGWVAQTGTYGSGGFNGDCVSGDEYVDIYRDLGSVQTITEVVVHYVATYMGGATDLNKLYLRVNDVWMLQASWTTQTGTIDKVFPIPNVAADGIRVVAYAGVADCTGSIKITGVDYEAVDTPWTYTIDWTNAANDEDGWSNNINATFWDPEDFGIFAAGTGWTGEETAKVSAPGEIAYSVGIFRTFAQPATIKSIVATIDYEATTFSGLTYAHTPFGAAQGPGDFFESFNPLTVGTHNYTWNGSEICEDLLIYIETSLLSGAPPILTKLVISGVGFNPFA